jgi:hypothetical protein
MSYRIAGIDVHKKMLAVLVTDVEIESEYQFERRMFSSNPEQLRSLATWLLEQEAEEDASRKLREIYSKRLESRPAESRRARGLGGVLCLQPGIGNKKLVMSFAPIRYKMYMGNSVPSDGASVFGDNNLKLCRHCIEES